MKHSMPSPSFVEANPQYSGERGEVLVRRQNGHGSPRSYGANEEIDVGSLDSPRTATTEKNRGRFVVKGVEQQVRERAQRIAKQIELSRDPDSRKDFLTNRTDNERAALVYKIG